MKSISRTLEALGVKDDFDIEMPMIEYIGSWPLVDMLSNYEVQMMWAIKAMAHDNTHRR